MIWTSSRTALGNRLWPRLHYFLTTFFGVKNRVLKLEKLKEGKEEEKKRDRKKFIII